MATNYTKIQLASDFEERYPNSSAKATECAMNLAYTADLLVKRISGLIQPYDLSPASGLVLSILADSKSPLPPNRIADRLILSRATVTGLIDSLEKRRYVSRRPHPSDRRMLMIEITEAGKEVAKTFRPIVHQHQKLWLEVLSDKEQQQLIDSLQRLQVAFLDSNT
jgi:DNA-binding MarR family transcriptional regulator